MLGEMADDLSISEAHFETLKGSSQSDFRSPTRPRLVRAISYLYSDVIRFCQHVCDLFSPRKKSKLLAVELHRHSSILTYAKGYDRRLGYSVSSSGSLSMTDFETVSMVSGSINGFLSWN
jgi:hypothetical protein